METRLASTHRDSPVSVSMCCATIHTESWYKNFFKNFFFPGHRKTWICGSLLLEKENVYKMFPMTLRYLTQDSFISLYFSPRQNVISIPCKSWWCHPPQDTTAALCTHPRKLRISYTNTHHHNWVRPFFLILNKLGRPKNKKDKNNLNMMVNKSNTTTLKTLKLVT